MSNSDFSGAEFDYAPGSIHGLRSWRMDAFGRLTGVTHKRIWTPGENTATCEAPPRRELCPKASLGEVQMWEENKYALMWRTTPPRPKPCGKDLSCKDGYHTSVPSHDFDPGCSCGFWAYFEDGFAEHGEVVGVIEGYGRTTIGTRGFRAEKARIVAFSTKGLTLTKTARLAALYPDAAHYANKAALVAAFPSLVAREWEPVGADFWTKPVPKSADESIASLYSQYAAQMMRYTLPNWTNP